MSSPKDHDPSIGSVSPEVCEVSLEPEDAESDEEPDELALVLFSVEEQLVIIQVATRENETNMHYSARYSSQASSASLTEPMISASENSKEFSDQVVKKRSVPASLGIQTSML